MCHRVRAILNVIDTSHTPIAKHRCLDLRRPGRLLLLQIFLNLAAACRSISNGPELRENSLHSVELQTRSRIAR